MVIIKELISTGQTNPTCEPADLTQHLSYQNSPAVFSVCRSSLNVQDKQTAIDSSDFNSTARARAHTLQYQLLSLSVRGSPPWRSAGETGWKPRTTCRFTWLVPARPTRFPGRNKGVCSAACRTPSSVKPSTLTPSVSDRGAPEPRGATTRRRGRARTRWAASGPQVDWRVPQRARTKGPGPLKPRPEPKMCCRTWERERWGVKLIWLQQKKN